MRSAGTLFAMIALASGAASCSMMPPPIPVMGSSEGISALAGTWNGEYASQATGRYGSIRFTLAAGSDTAFGDVLMLPRRTMRATPSRDFNVVSPSPAPHALSVAFVRASGDSVYGYLDPYHDPECDCVLVTRFVGRLHGNRIEGRYETLNVSTREVTWGDWNVRRKPLERSQASAND